MIASESIWVGMRLRPLVERERGQRHCLRIEDKQVYVSTEALDAKQQLDVQKKAFAFDVAMDSTDPNSPEYVSQERCYELMGERMVQHMLQGFNTCLFCYGQTGTGKTTTIMGNDKPRSERGLLMRLVDDVFAEAEKRREEGCQVHVVLQMLEVYNEKLNDLLVEPDSGPTNASPGMVKNKIKIHVHPELGVYLTNATEAQVSTAEECIKTIGFGNTMKVVHATAMNAQSSRGHTICKLKMFTQGGKDNQISNAEVYFADLAGRENEKDTQVTGERFVELGFINKSLHHLANCIRDLGQAPKRRRSLTEPSSTKKAPPVQPNDMSKFRNSKLTLLLSNALSGNSRTSMIGTLSPAPSNFEESHNTLKFASTVKTIKVQAKATKAVDKDALVKELKSEIQELRKQLEQAKEKHDDEAAQQIQENLEASKAIFAVETRDWVHFQEATEQRRKRSKRSSFLLSSHDMNEMPLPFLANYSEDPHLAFKLVMHVPNDGVERSLGTDSDCAFRLPPGLGVSATTGYIRHDEGRVLLRPAPPPNGHGRAGAIEVNGSKLINEQELKHLDCILFGRSTVTTFYLFLQRASPEELQEKLRTSRAEMEDGRITQQLVDSILGEARSKDPVEAKLAGDYCNQLQSQNRDREGELMLKAFMIGARRAQAKVDEANELTRLVRPASGLQFELAAQAPVLSYGFNDCANLPQLCVRLVKRTSPLERFRAAARKVMALYGKNRIQAAVLSVLPGANNRGSGHSGESRLLCTWTLPKFMARLEMMYEVRSDPKLQVDRWKDPWTEYGLTEVDELREEHQRHIEDLRARMRDREQEMQATQQQLSLLQEELRAAKAELARRNDKPREVEESMGRNCQGELPVDRGLPERLLELGKANKALLESLCLEQRESLEL